MKRLGMLGLFGMVACAGPTVWQRPPGVTEADFDRDLAQCQFEAEAASVGTARGYQTVIGSALEESMTRQRLLRLCLQGRGYRQQEA